MPNLPLVGDAPSHAVEGGEKGLEGLKHVLTKKYGPLPGWAYVGTAAVVIFFLMARGGKPVSATQDMASGSDSTISGGTGTAPSPGFPGIGDPAPVITPLPPLPFIPPPPGPTPPGAIAPMPPTPSPITSPTAPWYSPAFSSLQPSESGLTLVGPTGDVSYYLPGTVVNGEGGFTDPATGAFFPGSQFPGYNPALTPTSPSATTSTPTQQPPAVTPHAEPTESTTTNDPQYHSYFGPGT